MIGDPGANGQWYAYTPFVLGVIPAHWYTYFGAVENGGEVATETQMAAGGRTVAGVGNTNPLITRASWTPYRENLYEHNYPGMCQSGNSHFLNEPGDIEWSVC